MDLDGAVEGESKNLAAAEAILRASSLKTQIGGGVRDMAGAERWLGLGMARVILGTAAVRDPEFVREAAKAFPGRVVLGIDARDGRVRTDGWLGDGGYSPVKLARIYEDIGACAIIYTDISRDGALSGVNIEATKALAEALSIPIIASGGLSNVAEITALASAHPNIEGVIAGRALYTGKISPGAALDAARLAR